MPRRHDRWRSPHIAPPADKAFRPGLSFRLGAPRPIRTRRVTRRGGGTTQKTSGKWRKVGGCGVLWCAAEEDGSAAGAGGAMFLGTYTPRLDDKGRLTLPAKFRDALAG